MCSTAACAGAMCGGSCCNACCMACKNCGVPAKNWPKLWYTVQAVLCMLISLIILFSSRSAAENWSIECVDPDGDEIMNSSSCYGIKAVLVMSWVLFLFHFVIFLIILPMQKCSEWIHDGFWGLKFIIIVVLYVAFFFVNTRFYIVWAHICRAGSLLYLIVQAYFILNACYDWNDKLLAINTHNRNAQSGTQALILIVSILGAIGIGFWLGYTLYFAGDCMLSRVVVIISISFVVLFYICSLLQVCNLNIFRENATIFTVTLASIYISCLTWSAAMTNYDSECSLNINESRNTVWQIIVGLLFSFITIISIATASEDEVKKGQSNSAGVSVIAEKASDCKQDKDQEAANIFPITVPTVIF